MTELMSHPLQEAFAGCSAGEGEVSVPTNHYVYEGVMYAHAFPPDVLDRVKTFPFNDHDVVVATYPKSGTTWMQEIVYLIHHDADTEKARSADIMTRVPFLELSPAIPNFTPAVDHLRDAHAPRLIKTHLQSCFYAAPLAEKNTKFVVVMRNPKDTLVSFYHFYRTNRGLGPFRGTWDEFFELVRQDQVCNGNWFDHTLSWWRHRDNPNVLILRYEEMLEDPVGCITRVAHHMGKPLTDQQIRTIAHHVSFDNMKKNPSANYTQHPLFDHKAAPFMRKGKVGDWKNYFSEEQSRYIDDLYAARMVPTGLHFQFE